MLLPCSHNRTNIIDELLSINHDKLELFGFNNINTIARVVDIYDGDTCTVIFKFKDEIIKYKVRCMGYDCPEMKPLLSISNRNEIIADAKKAKQRFSELVDFENGGIVYLKLGNFDKYGRLLGTFFKDDRYDLEESINNIMIKEGHGYCYNGGTKKKN
jgi:endonuclease YncB( thermonuclease family)